MFDELLDDDPYIKARVEQAGIQELQHTVIDYVNRRFPMLQEEAEQLVTQFQDREKLRELLWVITNAHDEVTARWLLKPPAA